MQANRLDDLRREVIGQPFRTGGFVVQIERRIAGADVTGGQQMADVVQQCRSDERGRTIRLLGGERGLEGVFALRDRLAAVQRAAVMVQQIEQFGDDVRHVACVSCQERAWAKRTRFAPARPP